jgi:hypothetical protein
LFDVVHQRTDAIDCYTQIVYFYRDDGLTDPLFSSTPVIISVIEIRQRESLG